jgi:beta-ureidopropionase
MENDTRRSFAKKAGMAAGYAAGSFLNLNPCLTLRPRCSETTRQRTPTSRRDTGSRMTCLKYSCAALILVAVPAALCGDGAAGKPIGRNPVVRVVSISQDGAKPDAKGTLLESAMERLNQAAAFQPDIACLPELFARSPAEPVPGPTTERLAEWARGHSCYIVAGVKKLAGGRTYNTAVLLDRQGRIAGQFDKIHPTEGELKQGITPGSLDPPVFETDFGLIGIQICFDVNWWDNWKRLKEKGAKLVLFPAAYPAAIQLAALALTNQYFVVSSPGSRQALIHDITGRVLAASGAYQQWAGAVLPLGRRLFEVDFHVQKMRQVQQKYGQKVDITWYHDDDWFTLASLDPDLTVEDLQKEFGLTPLNDYRERAAKAIDAARPRPNQSGGAAN